MKDRIFVISVITTLAILVVFSIICIIDLTSNVKTLYSTIEDLQKNGNEKIKAAEIRINSEISRIDSENRLLKVKNSELSGAWSELMNKTDVLTSMVEEINGRSEFQSKSKSK